MIIKYYTIAFESRNYIKGIYFKGHSKKFRRNLFMAILVWVSLSVHYVNFYVID